MPNCLMPGLNAETTFTVEEKHLASVIGSGLVKVFATAMMIGGMESASVKAVQDLLKKGETTVGVHVDVAHIKATPSGMNVRFYAILEEISQNGKGLLFSVKAYDELGIIGEGTHRRVIIDQKAFEQKTKAKKIAHK